jgi:hypothetical protein
MDFSQAVDKLLSIVGDDLVSFEGIDAPNHEGEFEFKVIRKDLTKQKIHVGSDRIYFRIPENYRD